MEYRVVVHDDPERLNSWARTCNLLSEIMHMHWCAAQLFADQIKERGNATVFRGTFECAEHFATRISNYWVFGFHVSIELKNGTVVRDFTTGPCCFVRLLGLRDCAGAVVYTEQNPESGVRVWYCEAHGEQTLARGHEVRRI